MESTADVMEMLKSSIELTYLGNSIISWLTALATLIVVAMVISLIKRLIIRKFSTLAEQSETKWDDIAVELVRKTKFWFVLMVAIFVASIPLTLPDKTRELIQSITIITLLIQGGIWVSNVIVARLEQYRQKQMKTDPASVTTLNAVGFISKIILWTVVLLLGLDNLGIDITALVAGLGVGGIAVALAVQNILGDLFASLSIVLDKPFAVGDFLIIDEHLGSVEHVGLKTTRLRSLSGEQLVFANSDLLSSRIRNYGRMFERRVVFNIGVTYQTPRDKLIMIPAILRQAVETQDRTRFDRAHFKEYGNFSINYETVYYVLAPDYNIYMDIQQAVNLFIHEHFEQEGIEFAYPTQTLFVKAETQPGPT
jgi:small-conductance mechanosensitive channel